MTNIIVDGVTFVNLNKHDIVLNHEGVDYVFPPSGQVATVKVEEQEDWEVGPFKSVCTRYGEIEGLPFPQKDVVYIVNALVLEKVRVLGRRGDVVAPDTGPSALRFADGPNKGQVKAVTRFKRP